MSRAVAAIIAAISIGSIIAIGHLLRASPSEAQSGGAVPVFSIRVEIDGIAQSTFRGVEDISVEREVVDFREAGSPNVVRKIPGSLKTNLLTLKLDPEPHGDSLWTWFNMVLNGEAQIRRNLSVVLVKDGRDLRRYNFLNAWPARWEGWRQVTPNATSPVETVAITFEKMERIQ